MDPPRSGDRDDVVVRRCVVGDGDSRGGREIGKERFFKLVCFQGRKGVTR